MVNQVAPEVINALINPFVNGDHKKEIRFVGNLCNFSFPIYLLRIQQIFCFNYWKMVNIYTAITKEGREAVNKNLFELLQSLKY